MRASAPVLYDYYVRQRFGSTLTKRHDCSSQLPVIGTSKREEWMAWIGDTRKHGDRDSQRGRHSPVDKDKLEDAL